MENYYDPFGVTNNNANQDSDESSFEETEEIEQEAVAPWQCTTVLPDNMNEFQRASNLVNMRYAYKSSINKEYAIFFISRK